MIVFTILLAALLSVDVSDSASLSRVDSTSLRLDEVTVVGSSCQPALRQSQSVIPVSPALMEQQFESSLSQTLEILPGVQSIAIGSGQSKPVIRGLGHQRLAVVHDGIRHEGQQWGDDHGLEIDQFAIDRVEVIKGPSALLYGADAIGGVLLLRSVVRAQRPVGGNVRLFFRSNNLLFGASARVEGQRDRFFWRANLTYSDYADMRVPADSFTYYSYRIPLYRGTLRNTAGREADAALVCGWTRYNWHTCLKVYETYATSGFFANAHGLEVRLSAIDYDRSRRDIDLPYQLVNHLKVLSHSVWQSDDWSVEVNGAWQYNLRQEHSEPISHGYMPTPVGTLERGFDKQTGTLHLVARRALGERHTLRFGGSGELQYNRRSGWGFILPDFEQYATGLYALWQYDVSRTLTVNAGVRYDYAHMHIGAYTDWYPSGPEGEYKQRSEDLHRHFHSATWNVGVAYAENGWSLKANIGKAFRVPTAKELGADGVNYHLFRYEQGNSSLHAEQSYQLDLSAGYDNGCWHVQVEPFVGYFPNYIYLDPTPEYREGLQLYRYTESRVLRAGGEGTVRYSPRRFLEMSVTGEYLFARQLSGNKRGYGLPFSPPWSMVFELLGKWSWTAGGMSGAEGYTGPNVRLTGAQYDIVPPELPTDGWWTLNLVAGQTFPTEGCLWSVALKADNILNRKYYNHISYYRLIDLPEPGWNLSVMLNIQF